MPEKIKTEQAARAYLARQDRTSHPAGKFDNAHRWWPADAEICACCAGIRTPSRQWPNSWNKHCRSAEHVAHLFGVDVTELRRAARKIKS